MHAENEDMKGVAKRLRRSVWTEIRTVGEGPQRQFRSRLPLPSQAVWMRGRLGAPQPPSGF